jgi:hypothetical protein
MRSRLTAGAVATAIVAALVAGCTLQDERVPGSSSQGGSSSSGANPAPPSGATSAPTTPMLVDVDANRTMSASPGDGVGVFTQYQTGGHWNVWWTCDTNKTGLPCSFDVSVTVSTGSIAEVAGQALTAGDTLTQAGSQQIQVLTTTTTAVAGVTFDTVVPPGTTPIITLDAELGGVSDPAYLFFVQDGTVNGGYSGMLTDPLMLEPSTP